MARGAAGADWRDLDGRELRRFCRVEVVKAEGGRKGGNGGGGGQAAAPLGPQSPRFVTGDNKTSASCSEKCSLAKGILIIVTDGGLAEFEGQIKRSELTAPSGPGHLYTRSGKTSQIEAY